MRYEKAYIERFENGTGEPAYLCDGIVKLNPGARIITSTVLGPAYLNRNTQVGPDVVVGKYFGMNESGFIARATVGAFCAFGARTSINPFNHPTDWLSINEFQYHPNSFDWVPEYRELQRLARTPDMFEHVTVGNDVWTGHNVYITDQNHGYEDLSLPISKQSQPERAVRIGDGSWLGHGTVVLPGSTIGRHVVVGAGSVVSGDLPDYSVCAGAPAKVIRRYVEGHGWVRP